MNQEPKHILDPAYEITTRFFHRKPRIIPRLPLEKEPPPFPPVVRGVPDIFPVVMWPAPRGVMAYWLEQQVFQIQDGEDQYLSQIDGIRPSLSRSEPALGWFSDKDASTYEIALMLKFNRPSRDLYWYIYEYATDGTAEERATLAQQEAIDNYNHQGVAQCFIAGKMSTFHNFLTQWLSWGNLGAYWQDTVASFTMPRYLAGIEERDALLPEKPTS